MIKGFGEPWVSLKEMALATVSCSGNASVEHDAAAGSCRRGWKTGSACADPDLLDKTVPSCQSKEFRRNRDVRLQREVPWLIYIGIWLAR